MKIQYLLSILVFASGAAAADVLDIGDHPTLFNLKSDTATNWTDYKSELPTSDIFEHIPKSKEIFSLNDLLQLTKVGNHSGILNLPVDHDKTFQPHHKENHVPAVPVPAAAWLFSSGLVGLLGFARRRNKN